MTAELFNTDPSKNDKPPPNGSPQNGLPLKRVSATFRVVMAGVADCWAAIKTMRGMATQDPAAVTITGGTIAGVTIAADVIINATAADCSKAFGHTVQQIYDLMYPVGEGRLFFNASQPPSWPNVVASWQLVSSGRYLRTSDPLDAGSTGGDASVSTSSSGTDSTSSTALTMANLPAGLLVNAYGETDTGGLFAKGNTARILQDTNEGGGQGHAHTGPAHVHTVQLTPLFVDVAMYRRVS